MANERAYTARNTGTKELPSWEVWYAVTVADAVKMSDDPDDKRTIVDYVNQKITDLIGGASIAFDTFREIEEYIASHKEVADALSSALVKKADKTVATSAADGLMGKADKVKLDGVAAGANKYVHPTGAGNNHIPAGGAAGQVLKYTADGTAQWAADYSDMKGATANAAGTHGLVPAPAAGKQGGYLRGDGTWQTPPNTTYGKATSAADGLMGKEDKAKLDGLPTVDMGSAFPANAPHNSIFLLIE